MLSGNTREGGMIDGHLRRVVMFPEDGHPELAFAVADVTGDPRDEVILWDLNSVWIYTQDKPFHWIRQRVLGGRSMSWGRQSYRMSDLDFKAASHDGYGDDWPV